jgi:hypothetical protein
MRSNFIFPLNLTNGRSTIQRGNIDFQVHSYGTDRNKSELTCAAAHFIERVNGTDFNGVQAIDMLQRQYTMDYGSKKAGSKAAPVNDEYIPVFYLDLLIIIGQPMKPITRPTDRFFDNVNVTFKDWHKSYSAKHTDGIPFELHQRTFRLATAATRESWFIVMHPTVPVMCELPTSKQDQRRRREEASRRSALQSHHAHFLATYIKWIFLTSELLGEGIEPSWKLGGPQSQNISFNKWTLFQEQFMDNWEDYVQCHTCDEFWINNKPAFHAYDYGANIEIQVNDQLQMLPREIRLQHDDEESESDSGDDEESQGSAEHLGSEYLIDTEEERSTRGTSENIADYHNLYPEGLRQLRTEMEQKYVLRNILNISYALAANINCLDASSPDPDDKLARCLLADRNIVLREYRSPQEFTFYPLAFHPVYGNFSSPQPPAFLVDNVLAVMRENIRFQNNGADVFRYGYFQGYSDIKSSIRHDPDSLLATKGIATGALTLPRQEAEASTLLKVKRQRLLGALRGDSTPEDPDTSRPFMRERRRIQAAIEGEEFAFRIEQVLSFQVSKLADMRRNFMTIFNPIFQLIRFFLQESQRYTHIFRSFRPSVFPGVLGSFATVFGHAIDEMHARLGATGSKGLCVASAEGVAALDRLGSYCFTGHPRSLMGSVLEPLGAIDSIKTGAWPHINPRLLDMRDGVGKLSVSQWPRTKNGRPILMHVASIEFHYGPQAAANRHSNVWFKEFSGMSVSGPRTMSRFLEELIQDLWVPQTVAFITHQFNRAIRMEGRAAECNGATMLQLQELERKRSLVQRWSQSAQPFSAR